MRCRYFIVIEKRECTQTHTKKYAYYFEFPCILIRERELKRELEISGVVAENWKCQNPTPTRPGSGNGKCQSYSQPRKRMKYLGRASSTLVSARALGLLVASNIYI